MYFAITAAAACQKLVRSTLHLTSPLSSLLSRYIVVSFISVRRNHRGPSRYGWRRSPHLPSLPTRLWSVIPAVGSGGYGAVKSDRR